jgi:hypothetical protein
MLAGGTAQAADICPVAVVGDEVVAGVIATRFIIVENTKLTCNVQCLQADNLACIELGASGIKLELNGFSTGSHNNRVRRSELVGNGSIASGGVGVPVPPGEPPFLVPNDFGVGLVGNSSGNVIEENGIGGNINGVLVFFTAAGNVIRKNVIAGNPPVQLGSSPAVGADIRDFSPAGTNKFEENLCITYTGATVPNPCPNIPQFSGHQNN